MGWKRCRTEFAALSRGDAGYGLLLGGVSCIAAHEQCCCAKWASLPCPWGSVPSSQGLEHLGWLVPASWPLCFDGAAGSARPLDEGCRAGCGAVRPPICIRVSWCCFPSLLWAGIKGRDMVLILGASLGRVWCH